MSSSDPMIGSAVARYEIVTRLGRGGMGVVYKARDRVLGRFVALKFLPGTYAPTPHALDRFQSEARAASALNHPNICTIYDIGDYRGQPYLVMECLTGATLSQLIDGKAMESERIVSYGLQIADALQAAHDRGIVHRDLKPANIFITGTDQVKILDFGLAKRLDAGDLEDSSASTLPAMTGTGAVVGTIAYMSPEQARGEALDHRSDVFSLGVVFYEMSTGRPPFAGDAVAVIFDEILNRAPAPITELNPAVPAELAEVFMKMLEKDPALRHQEMRQVGADLSRFRAGTLPPVPAQAALSQDSIAVLPFVNIGGDPEQEYFSDGLAEDLINALARVRGLRVSARTSSFRFRGKQDDVRDVGRLLNVSKVMEGSVRKAGNRFRVSLQLVDVENGYQVWADRYDFEMQDMFAMQDQVSTSVVDALKMQLVDSKTRIVRTQNVEAYEHVLKGRFYWNKRTQEGLRLAVDHFSKAIAIDDECAAAYSGLCDAYFAIEFHGAASPQQAYPKARAAAVKALSIQSNMEQAQTSLAHIMALYEWKWQEAERGFQAALRINENYMQAHLYYATDVLATTGRLDEALAEINSALQLDPLSLIVNACAGGVLVFCRKYDEAIEQLLRTVELEPTFYFAHWTLGRAYMLGGDTDKAIDAFQRACDLHAGHPLTRGGLASALSMAGRREEALEILQQLHRLPDSVYVPASMIAAVYVALGEFDLAFEWLERAYVERCGWLSWIKVEPRMDPLRSDPRFRSLLSRMHLEDDQLSQARRISATGSAETAGSGGAGSSQASASRSSDASRWPPPRF